MWLCSRVLVSSLVLIYAYRISVKVLCGSVPSIQSSYGTFTKNSGHC